jgi:hypothetical protein
MLAINCDYYLTQHFLSIYGSAALVDVGHFISFLNQYTVGRTPWTRDQLIARLLHRHRTTQTRNKGAQTSMPRLGLEPTIPEFERGKTVHALDRVATVIGNTLMVFVTSKSASFL